MAAAGLFGCCLWAVGLNQLAQQASATRLETPVQYPDEVEYFLQEELQQQERTKGNEGSHAQAHNIQAYRFHGVASSAVQVNNRLSSSKSPVSDPAGVSPGNCGASTVSSHKETNSAARLRFWLRASYRVRSR